MNVWRFSAGAPCIPITEQTRATLSARGAVVWRRVHKHIGFYRRNRITGRWTASLERDWV